MLQTVGIQRCQPDVSRELESTRLRGHVDVLADVDPLNSIVSLPGLSFDDVVAVAGIPLIRVVVVAEQVLFSLPMPPSIVSFPSPPMS